MGSNLVLVLSETVLVIEPKFVPFPKVG